MRMDEIESDVKSASFEFFYWFSRFEFALKENGCLKDTTLGAKAEPNWDCFLVRHSEHYSPSSDASELLKLHPKRQIIGEGGTLTWKPVGVAHCNNSLCCIITMLKAIRNNLFHGGKHGDTQVDDQKRNLQLLKCAKLVLDEFAVIAGWENDYQRIY